MNTPPANTSRLLLSEHPLVLLPKLAVAIGLNEAVFLQQLHYWLQRAQERGGIGVIHDDRRWIYNTIPAWCQQFPFLSSRTVQRVVSNLSRRGLVITDTLARFPEVAQQTGHDPRDRISFYTINYERLASLATEATTSPHPAAKAATRQIGALHDAMEGSCSAPRGHHIYRTEITPTKEEQQQSNKSAPTTPIAGNAAAPAGQSRNHKRERTHRQTGIVYWYDDELDDIARDIEEFGADDMRSMATRFHQAGKVPLRHPVAEALRAERASQLAEARERAKREQAIQEQKARTERCNNPTVRAAAEKARADLIRQLGIKVKP